MHIHVSKQSIFLGSSAVEQATVNRLAAGSNPARGAIECIQVVKH